jgi:L,D-transpeptidase YcbB
MREMNNLKWLNGWLVLFFLAGILITGGCRRSIKKEASGIDEAVFYGVQNEIQKLIEGKGKDSLSLPEIASIRPEASIFIKKFYSERKNKEAWSSHQKLSKNFLELELSLRSANVYGLDTAFYHLDKIHSILSLIKVEENDEKKNRFLAELDILSTNAYLLFAIHMNKGAIDPITLKTTFKGDQLKFDLVKYLEKALKAGSIEVSLVSLQPPQKQYALLQKALERFLNINDINTKVYYVPECTGDSSSCYSRTKEALIAQHYIDTLSAKDKRKLSEAIKNFQHFHGLQETGKPGINTREALAQSTRDKYEQIAVNLERWRWENPWADKHIYVNIPAYRLQIIKKGDPLLSYRVIVGAPKTPTPELSSEVKNVISNPYWNVPYSISSKEILPLLQNDPEYLSSRNFKVYDRNENEIDPNGINWSEVSASNLSYSFRQEPGTFNSLGIIKFDFPNKHGVYVHDTPNHSLFNKETRCLSHGCIRVEDPLTLSNFLFKEEGRHEIAKKVDSLVYNGVHRTVGLKKPISIYIRYRTAEADKEGNVFYFRDIYKKDELIKKGLFKR